ncbi:MAG TPA: hypothetical protein VE967_04815 [Gemmatimonadaceae bacterium]|nr:hypothetical protein [Gemmatimonadaceae bacterium]
MLNRSLLVGLAATSAALGHALQAQSGSPQSPRTDVPVRNVVLFSSGVGYFEHAGTVRGDGATELRFSANQINDILKSLVLQDLDGGRISTITYPSQDPLARALHSFQVDITGNPSLASLLNQLRGARITAVAPGGEKISGSILGVEVRRHEVASGQPVETPVLNILTGANIRAIELPSVTSLALDDPQLQDELGKALAALSQARDQDKKPVTINFTGNGERHVRIGYVVETPIWKTSYRLLLDDKTSRLQGWAIVENQTESDWNNVSLSLVSGRPISFTMDLYQPLYGVRPVVVQELFAGLRPQLYDAGTEDVKEKAAMQTPAPATPRAPAGGMAGAGGGRGGRGGIADALKRDDAAMRAENLTARMSAPMDAASSIASIAQAARLGELFQYTVPNVTLPRQKSAMLPIITDSVSVERLSIFNADVLARNPLNGVRLKNITGKHWLQGPVTVLDKNSYAGDARLDNVPPGQERLLSFGIDLDMVVDNTKNTQSSAVVTARINKGELIVDQKFVASQEYRVDNKGSRDKTIVIEHPIKQGWKLVDTQKPVETTDKLYRFEGPAPANKVTTLTVKEEVVRSESVAMLPADIGQLLSYSKTGEIPATVRDAIAKAIQLRQALLDTERQIGEHTKQISDITEEQGRMRENMRILASTTEYYQRLLAKLNVQETTIERLRRERDDLQARRDAQQNALETYLSNLTVG